VKATPRTPTFGRVARKLRAVHAGQHLPSEVQEEHAIAIRKLELLVASAAWAICDAVDDPAVRRAVSIYVAKEGEFKWKRDLEALAAEGAHERARSIVR
jgi:hypothetical protein